VLTLLLVGRYLDKTQLAIFTIFQLVFRLGLSVFDPGMFISVIQKKLRNKVIMSSLDKWQLFFVIMISFAIVLWFAQSGSIDTNLIAIMYLGICTLFWIGATSKFQSQLIADNRQKEVFWAQVLAYGIEFIFIVAALNYIPALWIFCMGLTIRVLIMFGWAWIIRIKKEENLFLKRNEYLDFSRNHVLTQLLSFIQGNYDTVFIGYLFGLPFLGVYNLACEFSFLLFSKINPIFNRAIFPVISYQMSDEQRQTLTWNTIQTYLIVMIPIHLFIGFNADTILHWAYPDKGMEIAGVVKYFIFIALIRGVNNILNTFILGSGNSRFILIWNVVILLINYLFILIFLYLKISLDLFLIWSVCYAFVLTLVILKWMHGENLFGINLKSDSASKLFFIILIFGIVLYVMQWIHVPFWIASLIAIIVYSILLYIFNRGILFNLLKLKLV
jgi:O-antigen/teichoic acid export membrane protein